MYALKKIGKICPKNSSQIKNSRFGIGLEKLDRDLYDPKDVYKPLAETGVKYVRIQSGWQKTEKVKGCYDFAWLDEIVDGIVSNSMIPWLCLCYGNPLYTEAAKNVRGSIGCPPISTPEEREAWDRYVSACVERYGDRIELFEIWNEPDGDHCWRHGANAAEYGRFANRTANAIRKTNRNAKIIAGAIFSPSSTTYLHEFLKEIKPGNIDYISCHQYKYIVETGVEEYAAGFKSMLESFDKNAGLIQGETGTQSEFSRQGAFCYGDWTPRKQAKFLLRKMVIDLKTDFLFTSYFTAVDMFENIMDESGDICKDYYGFFGILGETFDREGKPCGSYYKKESYYALQNLCAAFARDYEKTVLPIFFERSYSIAIGREDDNPYSVNSSIKYQGFKNEKGHAFVYWNASDLMTTDYTSTISVRCFNLSSDVKILDTYTGEVFVPSESAVTAKDGEIALSHIPIKDYPLILTFGDFYDYSAE